jgi:pimeloyl-ACP methyl ester carboxylesterase
MNVVGGGSLQRPEIGRFLQQQERWFPCGAHRMRYLHLSACTPALRPRPALVFVHGLMGYSFSWRHNLEFFARHQDVYALDLLGIGHSDRPETGSADFGLAATASRLLDFLRWLGHSQIDLIATSHGGAVAMMAASQDRSAPEPILRRLVLVAPAHPFMPNARFRLAFFRTPFGRMVMRRIAAHSAALRGKAMGRMYADDSRITPETRAGYDVNLGDPRSYDYALEVVRTWRPDMEQLRLALYSIAALPVLLLWGADDAVVSARSGVLLKQFFRDAQYVVLPDVGHLPYEEAPEEFNRLVLQFLES